MKDWRLGEQSGLLQYALVKWTPSAASRSRFGVSTNDEPANPASLALCWSEKSIRILGTGAFGVIRASASGLPFQFSEIDTIFFRVADERQLRQAQRPRGHEKNLIVGRAECNRGRMGIALDLARAMLSVRWPIVPTFC